MSNLSILSIVLGLGVAAPQVYGLARPAAFSQALRNFPRSYPIGVALMVMGTAWFLWNVGQESIADFSSYKNLLMMGFAAIGLGSCVFVRDFLAVRGFAVVLLLLAKLMVDTGRPFLDKTQWVLVIQVWAYLLVLVGMWLTVSPWRLRDFIGYITSNHQRLKIGCGVRLAFGLAIVCLGLFKF